MKLYPIHVTFTVAILVVLAACGKASSAIQVEQPWGRPSPMAAGTGAFYMVIKNSDDEADALIGVKSAACGLLELHESYMLQDGVMGMRPIEGGRLEIPAGSQVELKVGGLHIMCTDLQQELRAGGKIDLNLIFEKAGTIDVQAEIREQ